jgi:predicted HD superfamily hydrolase involved in NAD metabolism
VKKEVRTLDVVDRYLPFLEQVLTPKRLRHSLGVMQVMGELAGVYALDRGTALAAGLLHDAAKDLDEAHYMALVEEAGIELRCPADADFNHYLHGPVGAYFVYRELEVADRLLLDAITTHTYYGGSNFDAPLCWCLRFSDILEPNRDWSEVKWLCTAAIRLRELAFAGRMEEGALLQTGQIVAWFEETGTPVHPNMVEVCRELTARLKVHSTFA